MDHSTHCDLLAEEVARFAGVVAEVPAAAPVPSCPGWAVADLALHVGTVHRWAERLVRARAQERIGRSDDVLDPGPPSPEWLREGGAALVATLRATDPDAPTWAWGRDQHVRFWSRRQLHETLVHRIDAELAAGRASAVEPAVAADAIDELLENLPASVRFSPKVALLRGDGRRLAVAPSDAEQSWVITLEPEGFAVGPGRGPAEATLSGRAADLLAVLYRRRGIEGSGVAMDGDHELVSFWLANSALE